MGGSGSSCPPATGARFPPPGPEGRVRGARSSRCSGLGKLRHGAGRGRLCRSRSQTPHPWGPRCHCRPRLPPPAPRPHSPGTRGSGRTRRPQPLAAGLSWAALPGETGWEAQSGPAEPREGAAPLAKCCGKRSSCPQGFSSSRGGGTRPPAPRARPHPAPWEEAGARHGPVGWQEGRGSPRWPQRHHAAGTRSWGPPVSPSHPTGAGRELRPSPGDRQGAPRTPPAPSTRQQGHGAGHSRGAVVVPHPRDMSPRCCCCWDTRSPGGWGQRCPACSPSEGTAGVRGGTGTPALWQ